MSASTPSGSIDIPPRLRHVCLLAVSLLTFLIHGYHPYADDAGLYIAGVEKLLHPALFPSASYFVLIGTRVEIFSLVVAGISKGLHLPLEMTLLGLHLLTIVAFMYGAWYVASLITSSQSGMWTAVCLAGCLFTLPVAGTSINIMDSYLGPRSLVAVLGLFAVGLTLERRWLLLVLVLLGSGAMHPEFTIYTASFVLVLGLLQADRVRLAIGACLLAACMATVFYFFPIDQPSSAAYQAAQQSRTYVFLSNWAWYEVLGLLAPLCLLSLAAVRLRLTNVAGQLATACVMAGVMSVVCSAFFVHPSGPSFVARLMMLRMFHIIYVQGVLLLGCGIGILSVENGRWLTYARVIGLGALAIGMFFVQKSAFGHSNHLELPGTKPMNAYVQAFVWMRENTPTSAVFAADPLLVFSAGEDEQNMRAISRRSILADYKDEGLAFILTSAPAGWLEQLNAQRGIATMTDAQRRELLIPLGASWIALPAAAKTNLPCPFRNEVLTLCRLK